MQHRTEEPARAEKATATYFACSRHGRVGGTWGLLLVITLVVRADKSDTINTNVKLYSSVLDLQRETDEQAAATTGHP